MTWEHTKAIYAAMPYPPGVTQSVLIRLADRAGKDGQCFPFQALLASDLNTTERSVQRAVATLKADGYVTTRRRGRQAITYTVHVRPDTGVVSDDEPEGTRPDTGFVSETRPDSARPDTGVVPTRHGRRVRPDTGVVQEEPVTTKEPPVVIATAADAALSIDDDDPWKDLDDAETDTPIEVATAETPKSATKAKAIERQIWDAFAEVLKYAPETTGERGKWNKGIKQLVDAGASPDMIAIRCREYQARWPNMNLNPMALAQHWGEMKPGVAPAASRAPGRRYGRYLESPGYSVEANEGYHQCPGDTVTHHPHCLPTAEEWHAVQAAALAAVTCVEHGVAHCDECTAA